MMGSQILQAHVEFWAVASTRRLCENARQSQAASWRAASSFPLVNYLLVVPRNCSLPSGSLWGQFTLGLIFSIYR
jgi:hypothetical protein